MDTKSYKPKGYLKMQKVKQIIAAAILMALFIGIVAIADTSDYQSKAQYAQAHPEWVKYMA